MQDVIRSMDPGLFWGLVVGFVAGVLSSWRFARTLERFRQSLDRARHHLEAGFGWLGAARENASAMAVVALLTMAATAGLGWAVFLRATG